MNSVEQGIKEARDLLIDMGGRNRLLNFKPTKKKTISIINTSSEALFKKLVGEEKACTLVPKLNGGPDASATDLKIETSIEKLDFPGHLSHVHKVSRSLLEEQGYNGLHLALGFLEWKEVDTATTIWKAPLLLIPVQLTPQSSIGFRVEWNKEEVRTNVAFQVKLKEMGIDLPDLEHGADWDHVSEYYYRVDRLGRERQWNLDESIYIDFFNFTKIIMWRDLDPDNWPKEKSPLDHSLMRLIFESGAQQKPGNAVSEEDLDETIDFKAHYYVQDADPSQIAAIEEVRKGRNLVVYGPPGTGKSQTIVNLIAEMLAAGKKILFVSEKLAALEVVKSRLDASNLGDFCLVLHGRNTKPKEFIQALKATVDVDVLTATAENENKFRTLDAKRNSLNRYAEALRSQNDRLDMSTFEVICKREAAVRHFERQGKIMPSTEVKLMQPITRERYDEAIRALEDLRTYCDGLVTINAWFGCRPTGMGLAFQDKIKKLLEEGIQTVRQMEATIDGWGELGIRDSRLLGELLSLAEAAEVVYEASRFRPHDPHWFHLMNQDKWRAKASALVETIDALQQGSRELRAEFHDSVFDKEMSAFLCACQPLKSWIFRITHFSDVQTVKAQLTRMYRNGPPRRLKRMLTDTDQLGSYLEERDKIRKTQDGRRFFGPHWKAEESDCREMEYFLDWGPRFNAFWQTGTLSDRTAEVVCHEIGLVHGMPRPEAFRRNYDSLNAIHEQLTHVLGADLETVFKKNKESLTLSDLSQRWMEWQSNLGKLRKWSVYVQKQDACRRTLALPVVELLENDRITADDLVPTFRGSVASEVLEEAFSDNEALGLFTAGAHEQQMQEFRELDLKTFAWNREFLRTKLLKEVPRLADNASEGAKSLNIEFFRGTKHKPIRKLFREAGSLIVKIKPCIMMSPLSVAQYLEPGKVEFDLVVFDEASQVRPADALGAILRGKQLVVMGDAQQLPPTSFFDKVFAPDDDGAGLVAVMQSILDLCKAAGLPSKQLKWHYRSKHESLIAVSNDQFYENRLIIFPSPSEKTDRLGLHFVHVPHAVYDKGRTRTNRTEARVVAEQVIDHYRRNLNLSLGVGTFSSEQCEAVVEEVERLRSGNPDLDDLFSQDRNDPFFVKNLETIQGDERDVIFISVGYGRDRAGVLTANFGPLNQNGGERRLNVLMTRAREKCVVFCNFVGAELHVGQNASKGVRVLQTFLEYARTADLSPRIGRDFDSFFERSVAETLIDHDIPVHPQVGCVGYRIDIGIPHPHKPGDYVLGIECDGRKYHSSRVARERDRLRQQVLESRGWTIHRVWSTDWYHQRDEAKRRLIEAVERALIEARESANEEVPVPPVIPVDLRPPSAIAEQVSVLTAAPHALSGGAGEATLDLERPVTIADIQASGSQHESSGSVEEKRSHSATQHAVDLIPTMAEADMGESLLMMIDSYGGEVPCDQQWENLCEYSVSARDQLQLVPRHQFLDSVQRQLVSLQRNGFLNKTDYSEWIITEQGLNLLRQRGLL